MFPGENECSVHCGQIFQPVCGSNNETFSNLCELEVAKCKGRWPNLTLISEGPCQQQRPQVEPIEFEEDCPEVCGQIYDPVCGTDGNLHIKIAFS